MKAFKLLYMRIILTLTGVSAFQPHLQDRQVSRSYRSSFETNSAITQYSTRLFSTVDDSAVGEDVIIAGPPAITVRDLTCSFDGGDNYQLNSASYVLPRGARVGLVGRNGCGKSTFLRILAESCGGVGAGESGRARENVVYTGEVECPRDVKVSFVEQEPPSPSGITVSDALLGITDSMQSASGFTSGVMSVYAAVRQYRIASLNAADDPDGFANAAAKMDSLNGWDVLTKADEVATKLRVKRLEDQPLSSLSGGERKRVALAAALVQEPDVLILDEPTNHLGEKIRSMLTILTVQPDYKLKFNFTNRSGSNPMAR
jgi:ATPase subunit of ABC transporter with duplicated ATPase domains